MPDTRTPFRLVAEGRGGTYDFNPTDSIHIGTDKLITCVGLYLPISDDRCFFAHINAFARRGRTGIAYRDVFDNEGEEIRKMTLDRLRRYAAAHGWSPRDVGRCVEAGGRKVVIMCPEYDQETDGKTKVGKFVVEGVRNFLGGNEGVFPEETVNDVKVQGFVVNHATGRVDTLKQVWKLNRFEVWYRVDSKDEPDEHFMEDGNWPRGDDWIVDVEADQARRRESHISQ